MQVLHQTQCNLNNLSIKRNTYLHFRQFENKIFKITYSTFLKNKGSINTRHKNKINKIQGLKYS